MWDLAEATQSGEWLRWVPSISANAQFTLASMLPSLFLKSICYAASREDLVANFPSFVWGVGWHAYHRDWWLPCLEKFLCKYNLLPIVSLRSVATWVREGKRAR